MFKSFEWSYHTDRHQYYNDFSTRNDLYAGKYGVLRYAARSALYTSSDVRYRPLFHTIYTNFGGLYWCNRQSNGTSSWDINVSTYDFNHFGSNAFLISDWTAGDGPNVSDACFVRLVE